MVTINDAGRNFHIKPRIELHGTSVLFDSRPVIIEKYTSHKIVFLNYFIQSRQGVKRD